MILTIARVHEGTRPVALQPFGWGIAEVETKETFNMLSALRTCTPESRVTTKIGIESSTSAAMRGTMTCTTLTMTSPSDITLR
jgi:hypothetical protein